MKRIGLLLAAFVAAAALSSCASAGAGADTALEGPKDTWCQRDVQYAGNDGKSTTLRCYFLYSDEGYQNSSLQSGVSAGPGLTIAVCSTQSTSASVMAANSYVIKTFPKNDATLGVKMSDRVWNEMYVKRGKEFQANGESKNPPAELREGSGYKLVNEESLKNFSLKKLVAQYILDNVLSN